MCLLNFQHSLNENVCLCILPSQTLLGHFLLHSVFTSITGVQSHIDSLSHIIIMDSISFNITMTDTSGSIAEEVV